MIINRVWAMPNKWTFMIKPIKELLSKYVLNNGKDWIDPFAGNSRIAKITNDLNTKQKTTYNLRAKDFVKLKKICNGKFKGCLIDPPYSSRQIKECYEGIGLEFNQSDSQDCVAFSKIKNKISKIIIPGGFVICCGWNSNGFGKNRGFKIIEILLVAHGGNGHNDTIVTVEQKITQEIEYKL